MRRFLEKVWSGVLKLFGILENDAKSSLKKFWEKHGLACVGSAVILFVVIPWFLSGVCGIYVTSVTGNTVLFLLTLLVATLIGLFEVESQDGFIATGDWYTLAFYLMILSPFIALSNTHVLWGVAVVVADIVAVGYFVFAMFRRVCRYVISVIKRI